MSALHFMLARLSVEEVRMRFACSFARVIIFHDTRGLRGISPQIKIPLKKAHFDLLTSVSDPENMDDLAR